MDQSEDWINPMKRLIDSRLPSAIGAGNSIYYMYILYVYASQSMTTQMTEPSDRLITRQDADCNAERLDLGDPDPIR